MLHYIFLNLRQYTNIFKQKKPHRYQDTQSFLENSKIGRKKEARRIYKILIEFHFELDILL